MVSLIKVDGKVHNLELSYLMELGKRIGFSPEAIQTIVERPIEFVNVPTHEKDRMNYLYILLFLMKIDAKATKAEEDLIYHFGLKLGFQGTMILEMIQGIKENLDKELPPQVLLNIIR